MGIRYLQFIIDYKDIFQNECRYKMVSSNLRRLSALSRCSREENLMQPQPCNCWLLGLNFHNQNQVKQVKTVWNVPPNFLRMNLLSQPPRRSCQRRHLLPGLKLIVQLIKSFLFIVGWQLHGVVVLFLKKSMVSNPSSKKHITPTTVFFQRLKVLLLAHLGGTIGSSLEGTFAEAVWEEG